MIRIGIVARRTIEEENRPMKDKFFFVNNFGKRLKKAGAISYGVIFPDGEFDESYLDIYDGFLFHSGPHIQLHQLCTLHYAIMNNKPVLGICLGEQVIGTYSYIVNEIKRQGKNVDYESIAEVFLPIEADETIYMKEVAGHDPEPDFYDWSVQKAKHEVFVKEGTLLYDIFKASSIMMPSLHYWVVKDIYGDFIVSGVSEEGYIEAIEHKDKFILGVQFHAELEDKNQVLFDRFVLACKECKENE